MFENAPKRILSAEDMDGQVARSLQQSRIKAIEYPFDGEGTSEWPKDLIPVEQIEEERLKLLEDLKARINEVDPNSEEGFKLIFKLASYDLRDGLNVARATGMSAENLRKLFKRAQLPIDQPLKNSLYSISFNFDESALEAKILELTKNTDLDESLKSEKAFLQHFSKITAGVMVDTYDVKDHLSNDAEKGRRPIDKIPLGEEEQKLLKEIQLVYNSIAFNNPQFDKKPEKKEVEGITLQEKAALHFTEAIKKEKIYDQRADKDQLLEAFVNGKLVPEIAKNCNFPPGETIKWTEKLYYQAAANAKKYAQTLGEFDYRKRLVEEMAMWCLDKASDHKLEPESIPIYSIFRGDRGQDYDEVHEWFALNAKRERPLSELHKEATTHFIQIQKLIQVLEKKAQSIKTQKKKTKILYSLEKRIQALQKMGKVLEKLSVSREEIISFEVRHPSVELLELLKEEDPFQYTGRAGEDLFWKGIDGGNHRPIMLGIGLPARKASVSQKEAVEIFADLLPESVKLMGGKERLAKDSLKRKETDYLQNKYIEHSNLFDAKDESLNYDGDPKDQYPMEIAEFSKPFEGVLIQGLYGTYREDEQKWTGREKLTEVEESNEETKDVSVGIHVYNEKQEKKIQLPVTMNGEIPLDKIMGRVNASPEGAYREKTKYIPLKAIRLPTGQVEVTLPPHPPALFVMDVFYVIREPAIPPQPKPINQVEYDDWLRKTAQVDSDFTEKKKEAFESLPAECRAFVTKLKNVPPLERIVRIQEYVQEIGFYDMDNGEIVYTKTHQTREERFETMRVRLDELRQREAQIPSSKHYAGVCVDFQELSSAMLLASGIKAGKATGIAVHGETEATTKDLHAFSYVPFPSKNGKRMVLEVDATPSAATSEQESVLKNVRQPSLRERFTEEDIVFVEEESQEEESDQVTSKKSQVQKQGEKEKADVRESDAETVRILKELTQEEQETVREVTELTPQERKQLAVIRETLQFSPLKHMLGSVSELQGRVMLLKTLIPIVESVKKTAGEDQPKKTSIQLVIKWRALLEEWNAILPPGRTNELFQVCAQIVKDLGSAQEYAAFIRLAHVTYEKPSIEAESLPETRAIAS